MEFIFLISNTVKRWKAPPRGGDGLTGGDSEGCPVLSRVQSVTRELTEGSLASWEQDVVARTPREELPRTRETTRRIPRTRPVLKQFYFILNLPIDLRASLKKFRDGRFFVFYLATGGNCFWRKMMQRAAWRSSWSGLVWSSRAGRARSSFVQRTDWVTSADNFLGLWFFAAGKQSISKEQFFVGFVFLFFLLFSGFVLLFFGARAVLDHCQSLSRDVLPTVEISGDEPNSRSCRRTQEIDGSATCTVIRDAQNPCRELS